MGILLGIVILGAIGGVGWYVWHKNTEKPQKEAAQQQSQETSKPPAKAKVAIPDGYVTHTNKERGFSVSYPGDWGPLAEAANPPAPNSVETLQIDKKIGDALLGGRFRVDIFKNSETKIIANKYGSTVSPVKQGNAYAWKVVAVNPADTQSQIGDTYNVKSFTNDGGVTVYDMEWSDEGVTYGRWVFERNGYFIEVNLPGIYQLDMALVAEKDLQTYRDTAKTIAQTIQAL